MHFRLLAIFFAGYVFLDWVSYIHPLQQSSITPWNPQAALAVALLALYGQRWIPVVFGAVLAAELIVRHMPAGLPTSMLVSLVLTLGCAAMAAALSGLVSTHGAIETRRGLGKLVGVVTIGTLVTGTLYVGALWASGATLPGRYFEALLQFWIGDCVGILVMLPPILICSDPMRRAELRSLASQPAVYLQAMTIALALWLVFGPAIAQPVKFFYVLFLPLIWIGVRFGLLGAAISLLAIQCGVILAAQLTDYPAITVFELQALLIALTVTGLFLGVTVDERRRAGEDLRQSLRLAAAGEMSAALAHELNQPLTALITYSRAAELLAQTRDADPTQLNETLAKILAEANRAADVVKRLRDFFRTGATELKPLSLSAIAGDAVNSLDAKAAQLGVDLQRKFDSPLPSVLADPLQIELVLRNLVANGVEAAAAAPPPRSVHVEISAGENGFVRALVRDSGPGVTAELRERVFEPFWTTRASGMGMGLAISRAIVEAHGGRIWVETRGQGAFAFTLPVQHG